jgi:hypothetical protein
MLTRLGPLPNRLQIDSDSAPPTASPARTALPAAHFEQTNRRPRRRIFKEITARQSRNQRRRKTTANRHECSAFIRVNLRPFVARESSRKNKILIGRSTKTSKSGAGSLPGLRFSSLRSLRPSVQSLSLRPSVQNDVTIICETVH